MYFEKVGDVNYFWYENFCVLPFQSTLFLLGHNGSRPNGNGYAVTDMDSFYFALLL
jgi:hypothetical protein